jgi:HSP20 family protein
MTIQRWDPFGEVTSLRSVMDRLFDDAVVRPSAGGQQGTTLSMPLDLYEKEDSLVVRASLPGIKPDDINITVQGNTVSIEGELRADHEAHGQPRHQEHRYGRVFRQVTLPSRIDSSRASAEFEHGVLILTLPKEEAARSRQIPIRSGGAVNAESHPAAQPKAVEASASSGAGEQSGNGKTQAKNGAAQTPGRS